jgi:hypothetical protein
MFNERYYRVNKEVDRRERERERLHQLDAIN